MLKLKEKRLNIDYECMREDLLFLDSFDWHMKIFWQFKKIHRQKFYARASVGKILCQLFLENKLSCYLKLFSDMAFRA